MKHFSALQSAKEVRTDARPGWGREWSFVYNADKLECSHERVAGESFIGSAPPSRATHMPRAFERLRPSQRTLKHLVMLHHGKLVLHPRYKIMPLLMLHAL